MQFESTQTPQWDKTNRKHASNQDAASGLAHSMSSQTENAECDHLQSLVGGVAEVKSGQRVYQVTPTQTVQETASLWNGSFRVFSFFQEDYAFINALMDQLWVEGWKHPSKRSTPLPCLILKAAAAVCQMRGWGADISSVVAVHQECVALGAGFSKFRCFILKIDDHFGIKCLQEDAVNMNWGKKKVNVASLQWSHRRGHHESLLWLHT